MFSFRRFYLSTKLKVKVLIKTNSILGSHKFTLQLAREREDYSPRQTNYLNYNIYCSTKETFSVRVWINVSIYRKHTNVLIQTWFLDMED